MKKSKKNLIGLIAVMLGLFLTTSGAEVIAQQLICIGGQYGIAKMPHPLNSPAYPDCEVAFEYCCSQNPATGEIRVSIGEIWIPDASKCSIEMIIEAKLPSYLPAMVGYVLEKCCRIQVKDCDALCCCSYPDCLDNPKEPDRKCEYENVIQLGILSCMTHTIYAPKYFSKYAPNAGGYGIANCRPLLACCYSEQRLCKILLADGTYSYCMPDLNVINAGAGAPCDNVTLPDGTFPCYRFCK